MVLLHILFTTLNRIHLCNKLYILTFYILHYQNFHFCQEMKSQVIDCISVRKNLNNSTCACIWDIFTLGWISVSTVHYSPPSLSSCRCLGCTAAPLVIFDPFENSLIQSLDSPSKRQYTYTHVHVDTQTDMY